MIGARIIRTLNTNPLAAPTQRYICWRFYGFLHPYYAPLHGLLLWGAVCAAYPLGLPISHNDTRLLAAMAVVIFAGQLVVTLRTVLIAAHVVAHATESPRRWAALSGSRLDARQIVLGQWWAVVRCTWRWHALTGLLLAGLALGVAQHVHASSFYLSCSPSFQFLCYHGFFAGRYDAQTLSIPFESAQPALFKMALAVPITLTGSILAGALAAAVGMVGALIAARRRVSPALLAVLLYVLLAGLVGSGIYEYIPRLPRSPGSPPYDYYSAYWHYWELSLSEFFASHLSVSGLIGALDGGMTMAADLLQPIEPSGGHTVQTLGLTAAAGIFVLLLTAIILRLAQFQYAGLGARRPPPLSIRQRIRQWWERWQRNPVLRYSQRSTPHPWRRVALLAAFAAALAFSWSTRWSPLRRTDITRLWVLAGFAAAVHAVGVLYTLTLATHEMRRESADRTAWDVLVMTGLDARQIVRGHWWTAFRAVWAYHALGAALKLGFVHTLAQYVSPTPILRPFSSLERLFGHISYDFAGGQWYNLFPSVFDNVTLYAGGFLLLLGLAEAALSSALGILSALAIPRRGMGQLALAVTLRALPVLGGLLFVWFTPDPIMPNPTEPYTPRETPYTIFFEWHNTIRIQNTARITASTLADGGLATTNLYRHVWSSFSTARKSAGLALGVMLYAQLTWLALRAAQWIAVRRGALPP